jgi:hypothetical protein
MYDEAAFGISEGCFFVTAHGVNPLKLLERYRSKTWIAKRGDAYNGLKFQDFLKLSAIAACFAFYNEASDFSYFTP